MQVVGQMCAIRTFRCGVYQARVLLNQALATGRLGTQMDTLATTVRARALKSWSRPKSPSSGPSAWIGGSTTMKAFKARKRKKETLDASNLHRTLPKGEFWATVWSQDYGCFFKPFCLPGSSFPLHKLVAWRALSLCLSEIGKYGRTQKQWHRFGRGRNELQEWRILVSPSCVRLVLGATCGEQGVHSGRGAYNVSTNALQTRCWQVACRMKTHYPM